MPSRSPPFSRRALPRPCPAPAAGAFPQARRQGRALQAVSEPCPKVQDKKGLPCAGQAVKPGKTGARQKMGRKITVGEALPCRPELPFSGTDGTCAPASGPRTLCLPSRQGRLRPLTASRRSGSAYHAAASATAPCRNVGKLTENARYRSCPLFLLLKHAAPPLKRCGAIVWRKQNAPSAFPAFLHSC